MTPTEIIAQVRNRLDEPTPAQWSDSQLRGWINEAMRDAARHTRHLRGTLTIDVLANAQQITLPDTVIEVERAYWLGDQREIPLEGISRHQADNQWGEWQNSHVGTPCAFSLWGTPPSLTARLYPIPQSAGQLSILTRRMPASIDTSGNNDGTAIDWPPAWSDLIVDYVEMAALRKDRDPRWREAFEFYVAKRDGLDVNGAYSDWEDSFEFHGPAGMLPHWLTEF